MLELFTILFVALLCGAAYAYFRYPAFRKAVSRGWAALLECLSGDARRRQSRAANAKQPAQASAPSARPASAPPTSAPLGGGTARTARAEGGAGISASASARILDLMKELEYKLMQQQQLIGSLQQRLDRCERQLQQLTTVHPKGGQQPADASQAKPQTQPQTQLPQTQQPRPQQPRPQQPTPQPVPQPASPATSLTVGRTYYAIRPSSERPRGFRHADWSPTRPSHAVYAMTVKAGGQEAEFTIDPSGMHEVLNALAYYKDCISYEAVAPDPRTYVPVAGCLRLSGGVWQVAAPIRLEGRA